MMKNNEEPIIQVKNLSKEYKIGIDTTYKTLSESITDTLRSPLSVLKNFNKQNESFWALKDINFEVNRGEVVGIIGRNGAGKSTLLKVLSRITSPSEGEIRLRGRVGSLLEVGTGFHPELTGRENIYFNGAILGMKKREIDEKFDEIVKFAEIDKFLDTPVKRYSSGMYVRLAFAVAAHMDPEILIVDEVLAVGDVAFQKKCLGKMSEVAEGGRTVLFVSHNMGAVRRLCQRGIVLSEGQVVYQGTSDDAVESYLKNISEKSSHSVYFKEDPNKIINIIEASVTSYGKKDWKILDISDPIGIEIKYVVKKDVKGTNLSVALSQNGVLLFRTWDIDSDLKIFENREAGHYFAYVSFPKNILNIGTYAVYIGAGRPGAEIIVQHQDCLVFQIENVNKDLNFLSASRGGLINIPIKWNRNRINEWVE